MQVRLQCKIFVFQQGKEEEQEGGKGKLSETCSLPQKFFTKARDGRITATTRTQIHTIAEREGGKKQQAHAYFTPRVNGNKIPWWMSADVFDTNSHFPICCLIEHDE